MALATDPGTTGIPYVTAGAFALSANVTIVNSGNSLSIANAGAAVASAGDFRTSSVFTWNARNALNTLDVNVVSKIDSGNTIQFGDSANNATTAVAAGTSVNISAAGTTILSLKTASPQLQLPGAGLDPTMQPVASATAAAGVNFNLFGQNRTASTGTSTGGTANLVGGDATGATATHNGGMASGRGGSATGASGTRTGGDFWAGGGTGATRNGNVYIGFTTPASFNWQSMGGGIAIQNASAVPAGNPTGAGYLYSEAGAGKWRGTGGTVTTFGPAEPHCQRCGADFAHEWQSDKYGHLAVCVKCLVGALERSGVAADEWVITRKSA